MTPDELDLFRTCFDIACSSMNWGSGFLDQEEVESLRAAAVLLGVDPWLATPPQMRPAYCPGHEWTEWKRSRWMQGHMQRRCTVCSKYEDERIPWVKQVNLDRPEPLVSTSDTLLITSRRYKSGLIMTADDPEWREPF